MILEKARTLPDELQKKVLQYVDALLAGEAEESEARSWSRFSADQLASQYVPSDAIYDRD